MPLGLLIDIGLGQVLPLPVTSLLPLALFPLFGILSTGEVSAEYFPTTCPLLIAGIVHQPRPSEQVIQSNSLSPRFPTQA